MTTTNGIDGVIISQTRLSYDYTQVDENVRKQVVDAALQIHVDSATTINNIINIGHQLITIKSLLPHGQFADWLSIEFSLSQRMAQNMMNVAREYNTPDKRSNVSLFSAGVLYLLAAPSTPDSARETIELQAVNGVRMPRAEVQRIIREHKPPPTPSPSRTVYWQPTTHQAETNPVETTITKAEYAQPSRVSVATYMQPATKPMDPPTNMEITIERRTESPKPSTAEALTEVMAMTDELIRLAHIPEGNWLEDDYALLARLTERHQEISELFAKEL